MRLPGWLLQQQVTVETYRGESAYGPLYDPPVAIRCRHESKRQLVRDRTGQEVVSESRLFAFPEAALTPESRVSVDGHTTTVLTVARHGGAHGETVYLEAALR